MINTALLVFDQAPLSSVALPIDILHSAGVFWNRLHGEPPVPRFRVRVVTENGAPVRCLGSISITPDGSMHELRENRPDLLIISPVASVTESFDQHSEAIELIRLLYQQGCHLASLCTGAFLLADTGLLDGKRATTHWGLSHHFAQRFPRVKLESHKTVTEEANIFCSGGANSGADLCLHLIRRYCGSQVAFHSARALVLDPSRVSQAPYEIFHYDKNHGDNEVVSAQNWIETNYHQEIQISSIAKKVGMSRRTFERRFKNATGESPRKYLQRVRVESARLMLETGMDTFENITSRVGYEDASSFRKIFTKTTGLAPSLYREKFRITAM